MAMGPGTIIMVIKENSTIEEGVGIEATAKEVSIEMETTKKEEILDAIEKKVETISVMGEISKEETMKEEDSEEEAEEITYRIVEVTIGTSTIIPNRERPKFPKSRK